MIEARFRQIDPSHRRKKEPVLFLTYSVLATKCCKKNLMARKAKSWETGPRCPDCHHQVKDWKLVGTFYASSKDDAIKKARLKLREKTC